MSPWGVPSGCLVMISRSANLRFSLQPVFQFVTGLLTALDIQLISTFLYLLCFSDGTDLTPLFGRGFLGTSSHVVSFFVLRLETSRKMISANMGRQRPSDVCFKRSS